MSAAHTACFAKNCLTDWYGDESVCGFKKAPDSDSWIMYVPELFSVRVDQTGEFHVATSRALGPVRCFSGKFLDLIVDRTEEEFPDMPKRQKYNF